MKQAMWQSTMLVAVVLAASACVGQSNRSDLIAKIPFRFVVANRTLPPGRYIISHMGETDIRIYNSENQGTLAPTHGVQGDAPEGAGKIVFLRYADTYVLSQVWFAANTTGRQVFRSRIEEGLSGKGAASEVAVLQVR